MIRRPGPDGLAERRRVGHLYFRRRRAGPQIQVADTKQDSQGAAKANGRRGALCFAKDLFPFSTQYSRRSVMGFLSWLLWGRGFGLGELARWLDMDARELRRFQPEYRRFTIPKRSGGTRRILAPDDELKKLQRRILRRLLARLRAHPAAHGFERGRSIVTNARAHQGQEVVARFDLVDFFPSTSIQRVKTYFRRIGWNRRCAKILTRLCTHEGGLPQGAPTSPRLSNLVNYRIDARLAGMADALGGVYTRYADDITISFPKDEPEEEWVMRAGEPPPFSLARCPKKIAFMRAFVRRVVGEEGYRVHRRKKQSVRRRHHRQMVTGLVVNDGVNLPRKTRRWLRAVEHRAKMAKETPFDFANPSAKRPTLTPSQLEGWRAFQAMIANQSTGGEE
ncbi:MAG: RNA-directed DNA polymerase [Planctomycetes bacterium]|nr:RNA-directed DNA polymerase [Planctomycetota bacterium]MBL7042882.1 RNA-directed DNA polymerase [Pirellulaceae bacterium]